MGKRTLYIGGSPGNVWAALLEWGENFSGEEPRGTAHVGDLSQKLAEYRSAGASDMPISISEKRVLEWLLEKMPEYIEIE